METTVAMPRVPEWDNLEICEQALATPRKRGQFLKGLMAASAGLAAAAAVGPAAGVLASTARGSAAIPQGDIDILNFALTLEWLERTFYEQAMLHVPFTQSNVRRLARTLRGDEITHTVALTAAVKGAGATPVGRAPHYNFPAAVFQTQSAFLGLSEALEDTGVHAYLGQAGNIMTPSILLTAATIVTVEARHAGAIRYQNGKAPTSGPFDTGFTKDQVLAVAGPLIGS